jgi:N-acetylglutamate synthase
MDIETVRGCEERLINVWPAVSTLLMDGWAIRFANGYSGRANSASAVVPGARMSAALLDEIERLYTEAGLKPSVRITPLADAGVEPLLMSRGYRIKDRSKMMVMPLQGYRGMAVDGRVRLEPAPGHRWLAGISRHQEASKRSADHLLAIVGQLRVKAAFATLDIDGDPAGFAMCAIDRGWAEIGSVMLDPTLRGKGLGGLTCVALLNWAADAGATQAFLQVDQTNAVARRLYARQGFSDLCDYRTIIKD